MHMIVVFSSALVSSVTPITRSVDSSLEMYKVVKEKNDYTSCTSGIAESMVHSKFLEQNTGAYFSVTTLG